MEHRRIGWVLNACWRPNGRAPKYLPPHFTRTGLLEGAINDPELWENQPEQRLQRRVDILQGQVAYLQTIAAELTKSMPKKPIDKPRQGGLYDD